LFGAYQSYWGVRHLLRPIVNMGPHLLNPPPQRAAPAEGGSGTQ